MAKHKVKRGDTWAITFTWKDADGVAIDLSGCAARLHIRQSADDDEAVLEAATDDDYLTFGVDTGTIELEIPASITEDIDPGTYVYDLEMTYLDGTVESTETVTLEVGIDVSRDAVEPTP